MTWFNRLTVRVCLILMGLLAAVTLSYFSLIKSSLQGQQPLLDQYLESARNQASASETARSTLDAAQMGAHLLSDALSTGDMVTVSTLVDAMGADQWIRQVSLYDRSGHLILEHRPSSVSDFSVTGQGDTASLRRSTVPLYRVADSNDDVSAWAPVWGADEPIATLFINRVVRDQAITANTVELQVREAWADLSASLMDGLTRGAGIALLINVLAILWLSREIGRPYDRLAAAFSGLGKGKRIRLRNDEGPTESRRLSDRFNFMADELEEANNQVREIAFTDPVTRLPNRSAVMERLSQILEQQAKAALLFVDLDDFKRVNDVFGHDVGDETLRQVSRRIESEVRTNGVGRQHDLVARLGGDEFVVILMPPPPEETLSAISSRVIQSVCQVIEIENRDIYVGASVGIAIADDQDSHPDTLLRHADMAMYQAKNAGKGQAIHFDQNMQVDANRMGVVERHLRHAIELGELRVEYQPILHAFGSVAGYEALVRWNNSLLGEVSPGEFIPVAEAYGMIGEIDLWIAETAIKAIAKFENDDGSPPFLSLNMSGQHFVNDDYTIRLLEIIQEQQIDPERLHIEITETALLRDEEKALDIVERLRDAGLMIYLDDFGTGFSSLSHLANFQLDGIKIDVSFVRGIPHDLGKTNLSAGLISLAHSLDLEVVAEGVEEQVQADFLGSLGCDYLQGWLFGKAAPLPVKEMQIQSA